MTKLPLTVLEFNGTTIRACRSVSQKAERTITHCFSFEADVLDDNTHKMIQRQLKIHALHPKNVILSLPRHQAISRSLRLPSSDIEEIKQMVALHISQESLFNKDRDIIIYDYEVVGFDAQGQALVTIFSIPDIRLKKYLGILEKLNITPVHVTLNTQGLLNWSCLQNVFKKSQGLRGFYLLNADHGTYDFNVVFGRHVVFSRTFVLNICDAKEAAKEVAKEVKVSLELFRRKKEKQFICEDTLYWVGSLKDSQKIEFQESFSQPLIFLSPSESIDLGPSLREAVSGSSVSFASVLGLALKGEKEGINMTPLELKKALRQKKMIDVLHKALMVLTAAFFSFSLLSFGALDKKITVLKNMTTQLAALGPLANEAALAQQFARIEKGLLGNFLFSDYLYELYRLTPASIFLISLDMDPQGALSLTGVADEPGSVFNYLRVLERSRILKSARLDYVEGKNRDSKTKEVKFKLIFLKEKE